MKEGQEKVALLLSKQNLGRHGHSFKFLVYPTPGMKRKHGGDKSYKVPHHNNTGHPFAGIFSKYGIRM